MIQHTVHRLSCLWLCVTEREIQAMRNGQQQATAAGFSWTLSSSTAATGAIPAEHFKYEVPLSPCRRYDMGDRRKGGHVETVWGTCVYLLCCCSCRLMSTWGRVVICRNQNAIALIAAPLITRRRGECWRFDGRDSFKRKDSDDPIILLLFFSSCVCSKKQCTAYLQ